LKDWYRLSKEETEQKLSTNVEKGLASSEASKRLAQYGTNELVEKEGKGPWKIFFTQFTSYLVILLLVAGVVSLFLEEYLDGTVIFFIVLANAVLGFTQEYRAEKTIRQLKKMAVPEVKVRRDGNVQTVRASQLVPGDMVLLETGNVVPADCRLTQVMHLKVQESALTGESAPVEKSLSPFQGDRTPTPGDMKNMVFAGTSVSYGRGEAIVVETGMSTELGKIATMIQGVADTKTPLQLKLNRVAGFLGIFALILVCVIFLLGLLRGEGVQLMLMTAISMAVAAVPEGLAAAVTIALALGTRRMLKRNALIRKLQAVETLGSVTVICSDKTGTLTENNMQVTRALSRERRFDFLGDDQEDQVKDPALVPLLTCGFLCNDTQFLGSGNDTGQKLAGDPTETSLVQLALQAGVSPENYQDAFPRVGEAPFDSERKRMSTVHRNQNVPAQLHALLQERPFSVWTKGAVDGLLECCDQVLGPDAVKPLSRKEKQKLMEQNQQWASEGFRVLGFAFKQMDDFSPEQEAGDLETGLVFIGMSGMIDPPRQEVFDAVNECNQAGITTIMITGDHPLTAKNIAGELGISDPKANVPPVTGMELSEMDEQSLEKTLQSSRVFARVSPQHKLRIVGALQRQGNIVAMTGDGVNDAPALKKADIGVAMGITGTDVSKEVADMVVLDDNFASIVAAVKEGRMIFENIRKFVKYLLTGNIAEIFVMVIAMVLGMPLPLIPLQILWVNLLTDGFPALALGIEKEEKGIMKRLPNRPDEGIFDRRTVLDIAWLGGLMGTLIFLVAGYFFRESGQDVGVFRTMAFTTLTVGQMGLPFSSRSRVQSAFSMGLTSNLALTGAVGLTFLLQVLVVYVPFLQGIFQTVPLSFWQFTTAVLVGSIGFFAEETEKWFLRRRDRSYS